MRDSVIQRFEFTLDLAWKAAQTYLLEIHGIEVRSPKSCFRESFRLELISYNDLWIDMVEKRNETVHTYNKDLADQMYEYIPKTIPLFEELLKKLC
jgi:nucleotidyltransferase substrate binding protein (TIGR01987 family)